jgi:hypothetical protein
MGNQYTTAPLRLEEAGGDEKNAKIVIKGRKLRLMWLDSYILCWSAEEHPYNDHDTRN